MYDNPYFRYYFILRSNYDTFAASEFKDAKPEFHQRKYMDIWIPVVHVNKKQNKIAIDALNSYCSGLLPLPQNAVNRKNIKYYNQVAQQFTKLEFGTEDTSREWHLPLKNISKARVVLIFHGTMCSVWEWEKSDNNHARPPYKGNVEKY